MVQIDAEATEKELELVRKVGHYLELFPSELPPKLEPTLLAVLLV